MTSTAHCGTISAVLIAILWLQSCSSSPGGELCEVVYDGSFCGCSQQAVSKAEGGFRLTDTCTTTSLTAADVVCCADPTYPASGICDCSSSDPPSSAPIITKRKCADTNQFDIVSCAVNGQLTSF